MREKEKSTHTMPGARQESNSKPDDGVVNDSFGTVDSADTTGTGEENEPCEPRDKSVNGENSDQENSRHRN